MAKRVYLAGPPYADEYRRRASALVERVVLPGADHNDPVMFGPRVADAVLHLARRVA